MTYITTRAEQSRIHVAMLNCYGLQGNETSHEAIKKLAYTEVVSGIGLEEDDPLAWSLLAAADAANHFIINQTGDEFAEFDLPSLTAALNGSRRLAILVVRLCGAAPVEEGKSTKWRNAGSAPVVKFPPSLFSEFLKSEEFE